MRAKGRTHLGHGLPVIEHTLGEGLAGGCRPERGGEAKRLHDRQVGLQVEDGGSRPLGLLEDVATLLIENRVDAAQRLQKDLILLATQHHSAYRKSAEVRTPEAESS